MGSQHSRVKNWKSCVLEKTQFKGPSPSWVEGAVAGTLNQLKHGDMERKLTLGLIPTSKGPYTGLVYGECSPQDEEETSEVDILPGCWT